MRVIVEKIRFLVVHSNYWSGFQAYFFVEFVAFLVEETIEIVEVTFRIDRNYTFFRNFEQRTLGSKSIDRMNFDTWTRIYNVPVYRTVKYIFAFTDFNELLFKLLLTIDLCMHMQNCQNNPKHELLYRFFHVFFFLPNRLLVKLKYALHHF